ncbi:condensin-2 complex subunit H2 [Crotalus tigris]|uniref:condensin-2 complex subunit H2 n=1 Tax=Crotalus tigris TaxID=88082 RepID=UPI00192F6ED5|nr:condensin-2 complex subunit H2 [Crotalus tigris]
MASRPSGKNKTAAAAMEDPESRFLHFLQPIRDLTKNWEVDVAAQLGEYLEELDQICISFDGGKTTMNFIEAALLIQGSACIYSKKVEYLYTLVYQALDFISNKKREKQPTSVGADGTDGDAGASTAAAAAEEEFLSLDDIQQASKTNMDLRDDQQQHTVPVVPLTPMALVPPEDSDKKDNPLFSRKGELLASRKDFRMNTCTPQNNGLFRLDLAGRSPTRCPAGTRSLAPTAGSMPMEVSACETPVLALDFSGEGSESQRPTGAASPAGDHEDGCDPFLADIPEEDGQEASLAGAEEHVAHQMSAPRNRGYMLRERPPAPDANPRLKDTGHPWRGLDPFSSSEDKPLKKGRPFSVPRGLEDFPGVKRKRRPSSKLQDFVSWFASSEPNQAGCQRRCRKGSTFADLEVLYWRNVKERLVAQRKLQKRAVPQLEWPCGDPGAVDDYREEEEDFDDAADDGPGEFLAEEEIPPLEPSEGMLGGAAGPGEVPSSLSYEELFSRNVELFMAHSQKYTRETALSQRVRDWEEMMGPQLEEQESRSAFDIHSYGDQLVSRFSRVGEWCSFASLLAGQPAFEVCRAMLASLQLANDYTVEICQQPGLEEAVDTMALRLLTRERAHQRFHTYTAPSLNQQ